MRPGSMVRPVPPQGFTSLATTTSKSTTQTGATWTLTPMGTAMVNWSDGVIVVLPTLWNDTTGTAAPTWPPTMRGPLGAVGVGVAATTGGGVAAAPSWVSARAGMATAKVTAAVANRNDKRTVSTVLQRTMAFSFRGLRCPLCGLNQCDRLRRDDVAGGDRGVAGGMLGVARDSEGPGAILGSPVPGRVGDAGREARGVRRAWLQEHAVREQSKGGGADLIDGRGHHDARRVGQREAARVHAGDGLGEGHLGDDVRVGAVDVDHPVADDHRHGRRALDDRGFGVGDPAVAQPAQHARLEHEVGVV